jgi:hypothetical protein
MAIIQFHTHGTQNATEYNASGGTISWSQGVQSWDFSVNTLEVGPVGTAVGWVEVNSPGANGRDTAFSLATTYISFYFSFVTLPITNSEEIIQVRQGTNVKFTVRIDSAGKLHGFNAGGTTQVGTGTTVLNTIQWYRLDLKVGSSATVGAYELKIDGAVEWSGTTNTNASNATNVRFGKVANRNGNDVYYYYGPLVIDDSAYVSEPYFYATSWSPSSNGSTMQWTSGTGTSDFSQVSEVPPDNANYVKNTASAGQVALFDFDDRAGSNFDLNSLPLSVKGRIRIAEDTGATSSQKIRMRSQNSTNTDTTGFDGTTTYGTLSLLRNTDPHTSIAWTGAALDDIEIGALESNAVADRCSFVMLDILFYTPIKPNVNESVTTTDYPNYYKDRILVIENVNVAFDVITRVINASDSVSVTENTNRLLESLINKVETIVLTENVKSELETFIQKSESIGVSETVANELINFINRSDSIAVAENINLLSLLGVIISDTIVTTDTASADVLIEANASDNIAAAEAIGLSLDNFIAVTESVVALDTAAVFADTGFKINVYDVVGGDPPKYIYTTEGEVLLFVARSGTKLFYEKI